MRLYIATSFQNIPEARALMDILTRSGHQVSHDWTQEAIDPAWPKEQQDSYLQQCGANDYRGVCSADAVVLINHEKARDAMAEFGIALGMDMRVFVLYPARRSSVFFHMAKLCETIPELLNDLGAP